MPRLVTVGLLATLTILVLASCGKSGPKHWSDPARDKVDVDVTPDGKWVRKADK
jgi:predicted small lipoprotein YifL